MQQIRHHLNPKNSNSVYLGCNQNYTRFVGLEFLKKIMSKADLNLNWQPSGHKYWSKPPKKKILVVEDHLIVQKAVKHQLKFFGVDVEAADTGEKALKLTQKTHFDLIVMDIDLPDQDGYSVAESIHQQKNQNCQPASIIVSLSANHDVQHPQRCHQSGILKSFTKPLDTQKARKMLALIGIEWNTL